MHQTWRAAGFLALWIVLTPNAYADGASMLPRVYAEPGAIKDRQLTGSTAVPDHVDPFSGSLSLSHVDLVLPGNGGLDIKIQRYYSSNIWFNRSNPLLPPSEQPIVLVPNVVLPPKPTGTGWTIGFGRVILATNFGTNVCNKWGNAIGGIGAVPTQASAVLETPDGGMQPLVVSNSGIADFITKKIWLANCYGANEGLTVYSPDGLKYTMNHKIYVTDEPNYTGSPVNVWYPTSIEDAKGNSLSIAYTGGRTGSHAHISGITSSDGRVVQFSYTGDVLTQISTGTRAWRYEYQPAPGLLGQQLLTKVIRPDGTEWAYGYNGSTGVAPWALNSVTAPYGGSVAYTYDLVDFDGNIAALAAYDKFPTPAIKTRILKGFGGVGLGAEAGTWTYDYRPGTDTTLEAGRMNDVTVVTSPVGTETYRHYGMQRFATETGFSADRLWSIGLLGAKIITGGGVTQTEVYNWGVPTDSSGVVWQISDQIDSPVGYGLQQQGIVTTQLLSKSVNRDGATYTTNYSYVVTDPRPIRQTETGQDTRITDLNWFPASTQGVWLYNQLLHEINPENDKYSNYRNFNWSNGNLDNVWLRGFYEEYTHTPQGDVATKKNGRGHTWEYQNYSRGLPQLERRPDSTSIQRVVNAHGLIDSETNGRNNTTRYTYDAMNRITDIDRPRGAGIDIGWSAVGGFKRTVTRGSYKEVTEYDGFGLVTCVDTSDGADHVTQQFRYNAMGHKTYESYPFDGSCSASSPAGDTFTTDALGRVTKVTHADSTSRSYDFVSPGGNKVKLTDERGKVTTYEYRSYGDPDKERFLMSVDAPENVRTVFERNPIGQVTSVKQGSYSTGSTPGTVIASETRTYEYNHVQNFLTGETNPEIGNTSYGRDGVGNMISRNVGGATTTYNYDPLNRLQFVNYPLGTPDVSLDEYDGNGNLKRLRTSIGRNLPDGSQHIYSTEQLFDYDANDNLTHESLNYSDAGTSASGVATVFESKLLEASYDYNTLDALTSITYPSTRVVTFSPDALGRPTRVGPFVNSVSYHPTGQPSSIDYANGQRTTIDLKTGSLRPWIDRIRTGSLSNLSYDYDDAGNVTRIVDGISPAYTQSMDYDGLNRLTTANGNWGSGSISYDAIGNIRSKTLGTQNLSYTYDGSNRLTSVTGARNYSFGYDSYGNAITNGVNLFTYDDASNLSTVSGGTVANYWYDGKNMRVREQKGTTTKYFFYASNGSLLGEYDRDGIRYKEYAYLGSKLVAMADTSSYPPVANAGSAQTVIEGANVTLAGSGTDADGSVIAYNWTQVAGPPVTLTNANTATTSFVAPLVSSSALLTFQLVVSDNEGLTGAATVNVTVQHINLPPTVNAGFDKFVDAGTGVSLEGSGADPEGTTVTFAWTQLSGPPVTLRGANTAMPIFNAPYVSVDSVLTFQLNVQDASGAVSSATVNVTVRVVATPNQLPTIVVNKGLVFAEGQLVTLTGTAQDTEAGPLTYQWTQLSGPSVVLNSPNEVTTTFVAPNVDADTAFTFELLVKDNTTAFAADVADVTVSNVTAPYSIAGIPGDGQATISWRAINGATSYNLYWGTASGVTPASGNQILNVTSPFVHASLTNGETYYYILTAINSEGETLPSAEVYVTPGVEGWGARMVLDYQDSNSSFPMAAMDGNGNAFFAWNGGGGVNGYSQAYVLRFSPETGWDPKLLLNNSVGTGVQVAANDSGAAFAIWSPIIGVNGDGVWARRYDPLAGWEPPVRLSLPGHTGTPTVAFWEPNIAINASGSAAAVWYEWVDTAEYVGFKGWVSIYTPGSGWGVPEILGDYSTSHVAMNAAGDIVVTYTQQTLKADGITYGVDIMARRYTTSGGWGAPMMVSDGQSLATLDFSTKTGLVLDDVGNFTVVWPVKDGVDIPPVCEGETCSDGTISPVSVWARRYIPATGWTPAVLLETANGQARMTRVAGNNSGNLIATWEQYDNVQGTVTVFAALYTPNVGWSVAQQISSPENDGTMAEVVMDRDGNATAVWMESVRGQLGYSPFIVAGRYRPSLGWVTQQLESNEEYAGGAFPVLALDTHGNVTAVWEHSTLLPGPIPWERKWSYSVVADRYTVIGSGSPSNQPPTANAGTAQTVNEGSAVTLSGTGTDTDGTIASYAWTQTAGPLVTLTTPSAASTTFTAPQVATDTVLSFQLTVTDNQGAAGTATTNVTVQNVNQLPTVNAGANQTVDEGAAVTLQGTATDADGTIASYAWSQTAGPAVTLNNAATATATFTAPQVTADTVLTFQLTVTDNTGGSAASTTTITVRNVNQSPVANAGTAQTIDEGALVTLTGSGTDNDGTIASYLWVQTVGPAVTLTNASTATPSFTAPQVTADTVLTFQLTVTDNLGATGNATVNVTVRNVNQLPTANAGANQTVNEGQVVSLTGTATDPDGTIAAYQWTQTAGPVVTLTGATTATASFTAPQVTADTVLTFQLTVTDNSNGTSSATTNVSVLNVNQLPTANAGTAQTVNEGSPVTLTGSGTDADGTIASYAWTQTAGPAVTLATPNAASTTFTAPQVTADTVLTFTLTVTDNLGATGTATTNITVANVNQSPTANAGTAQTVNEGSAVTLSGTATDTDGTIASYAWTQSAGPAVTLTNSSTAVASFTAPPVTADTVLTFQLTVTDNQGATGTATTNVTVANVNAPPTANAGPAQTVNEDSAVTLSGTGTDTDGTIASYAWTQTAGPAVTLTNASTAVASFTAPPVTADTVLTFQLTVTDNQGATGTATTNVTVANVAVAQPDLTITALTAPVTSIQRGRTMTVSYTLQNLGTAAVPLTATAIYLSTDATITTGDRAVGAGATGQLAAGASTTRNAFVFIPFRTTPGTYYLGAFVDPTNRQVESDETNNSFTGATIQVTP